MEASAKGSPEPFFSIIILNPFSSKKLGTKPKERLRSNSKEASAPSNEYPLYSKLFTVSNKGENSSFSAVRPYSSAL